MKLIRADRKAGRHMRDEGVAERVRLLDEVVTELLSHSSAEEQHVYSVLEKLPGAREQIADSRSEHHEMEVLLKQLLSIEYSSDRWLSTFEELDELITHHVDEEESTLFELAKQHLSKAQLKSMDERFQEEKQTQREKLSGGAYALPRG